MTNDQIRKVFTELGITEIHEPSTGHYQITGTVNMVNWWPFSKNRSAHIKGAKEGIMACDIEDVAAMASGQKPPRWTTVLNDASMARIMGPNWGKVFPTVDAGAEAADEPADDPNWTGTREVKDANGRVVEVIYRAPDYHQRLAALPPATGGTPWH